MERSRSSPALGLRVPKLRRDKSSSRGPVADARIRLGDYVYLRSGSGFYMDVENSRVRCRFDSPGQLQQQFQLCPYLGSKPSTADSRAGPPESLKLVNSKTFAHRPLRDGDTLCLLARSGCFLGVSSSQVGEGSLISSGPSMGRQWVRADFADGASPQCAFVLRTAGVSPEVLDRGEISLQNLASSQVVGHCDGEANPHSLVSTAQKLDVSVVDCRLSVEKVPQVIWKSREAPDGLPESPAAAGTREACTWLADGIDLKPMAVALAKALKPLRASGRGWEHLASALPAYYQMAARGARRKASPGLFAVASPPYTLVERQDRALQVVADMAETTSSGHSPCLVLVDGAPFLLSREAEAEAAKLLDVPKSKVRCQKARAQNHPLAVYRSLDAPVVLIDGEYLSRLGVGGGHSLLTTTASGTISLLCRLPKALVKEQIHEVWAGRPRYSQSAVYVVTLDVGSLRSKCLHLEQAVFHKMVSSEYQCGPPVLLSMTSRVQRAQLQLRPTVFNALGLAEVAVCLVVIDHSVMSHDSWRLAGYTLVAVRQRKGSEAFLTSAARLLAELERWELQLSVVTSPAATSSVGKLVREERADMLRLITEQLSKPGLSEQALPFFKAELERMAGAKAKSHAALQASPRSRLAALTPLAPLLPSEGPSPGIDELRGQLAERVESLLLRLRQAAPGKHPAWS